MQKLLILANSGRVRFLVFKQSGDNALEKAHLLEGPGSPVEMRPAAVHGTVTDHAGRFRQGTAASQAGGMSYGEEYEFEEQLETEALRRVAAKIDEIVSVAGYPSWQLVAPSTLLPGLRDTLSPATLKALAHSETGDLTKLPLADLEKRFLA